MNIRELDKIIGGIGSNPYSAITSILIASNRKFNEKYTKEEQEQMKREREALRKEEIRRLEVRQGICPSCKGKLIRGKKDKRNNYKRTWKCKDCEETHLV